MKKSNVYSATFLEYFYLILVSGRNIILLYDYKLRKEGKKFLEGEIRMKKKFSSKNILLILVLITTLLFSGCSLFNNGNQEDVKNVSNNDVDTNVQTFTIADLKGEFTTLGTSTENKYLFKPFYNVEQTTEFTFHFNSFVDPVKAVTVHTDSKCEENSTVFQINDGYYVSDGVDVVVKPRKAVLGDNKQVKDGIWGYAPIYYLCVRYDLDSTTQKKLDEPIVIPFTIRNEVSTPNAYAEISNDGIFKVKWLAVDDAVSYNVYRTFGSIVTELTAEERAYAMDINLEKVATLDSSTLEFIDNGKEDKGNWMSEKKNGANYMKSTGYVTSQNNECLLYRYYITAVDKNGNESFFSRCVNPGSYFSQMPVRVSTKFPTYLNEFPDTVEVLQGDQKTNATYPINFYKDGDVSYDGKKCKYRYEIPGTLLTGDVNYENENGTFPDKVESAYAQIKRGDIDKPQIEVIPKVTVDTMRDSAYENSKVDLAKKVDYPAEAKIKLDPASILIRTDLEVARMISGKYTKSLDSIKSYVANEKPQFVIVKFENGVIEVRENTDATETVKPEETNPAETVKPEETKPTETVKPEENKPAESTKSETDEVKEINNINYVEEQRKSTERQVEEADKEKISGTKYPVVANTAGQKYLALSLINQADVISLKAFPEYQNFDELWDDLLYVWYQNPYIMGVDFNHTLISNDGQAIKIDYFVDNATAKKYQEEVYKKANSVANSVTNSSMNAQEKVIAIYDYLMNNSEYNYAAYELMTSSAKDTCYDVYPNSWNTYGILCEQKGVCQSYAYAFNAIAHEAGLDTTMVTGSLDGGGHAWNAVKLDGKWYMLDVTNNGKTSGVPYWVCNSSTDYISKVGFELDDGFVDGIDYNKFLINDDTKDWYAMNDLRCDTVKECVDVLIKNLDADNLIVFIYNKPTDTDEKIKSFVKEFFEELSTRGIAEEKLIPWTFDTMMPNGMALIVREK